MRGKIINWLLVGMMATVSWAEEADLTVTRSWTDIRGREVDATLTAADQLRATLLLDGGRTVWIPLEELVEENRAFIANWREEHPRFPWVDPDRMPPWPKGVSTGRMAVERLGSEANASGLIAYRSAHFELQSDIDVPEAVWADVATVLEATREMVFALPLGFRSKPILPRGYRWIDSRARLRYDPNHLYVQFFSTPQRYAQTGAPGGSGGFYASWRKQMVISLENFGVKTVDGRQELAYRENLFVLKHEVSHQLMHHWLAFMPMWLSEGLSEYIAAIPYHEGVYRFKDFDVAFLTYLNKWRFNENHRVIPMLEPGKLVKMTSQEWSAAVQRETPILNYNSAALLSHYFVHIDGKGDAAALARFFDSVRLDPLKANAALESCLYRGRASEEMEREIAAYWKKKGVEIQFR